MARILCVNPWITDFSAYNLWMEPLGLLCVAGYLRQQGHEVVLLDCLDRHHPSAPAPRQSRDRYGCGHFHKVELAKPEVLSQVPRRWGRYGLPVEVIQAELSGQQQPTAVLVTSMMTYWYPGVFECIRLVKQQWPGVPIALGGVYATLCSDHARRYSGADVVITGQGEGGAAEWVSGLLGQPLAAVPAARPIRPAHDLRRPQGYVAILSSVGCPYDCPYCASRRLSGGYQARPVAEVLSEITWCVGELGATDIAFYDDALLFDASNHMLPLLEGIIERDLAVRFHTPNGVHARFVSEELAQRLLRAGFVTIRLGLDTAAPTGCLGDTGKVDEPSLRRAVAHLRAAGFSRGKMAAYTLIGRPGQSPQRAWEAVAAAHRVGIPVIPAQYSPVPGTEEFEAAVHLGLFEADCDPLLHNNSIYPSGGEADWEAFKRAVRQANLALSADQLAQD